MPQGKRFTESQRKAILKYADKHTLEEAAEKYGCSHSSISRWRTVGTKDAKVPGTRKPPKRKPRKRKPTRGDTDLVQLRDLLISRAENLEATAAKLRSAADALQ